MFRLFVLGSCSILDSDLDSIVDQMHQEILSKKHKNVEIIHLAAQITRRLFGMSLSKCEK